MSHYDYLDKNFGEFLRKLGQPEFIVNSCSGLISAHGDKFYTYRETFEEAGIPFEKGVAIGLLTYIRPFAQECRETEQGWIPVEKWIVENKNRFLSLLPS